MITVNHSDSIDFIGNVIKHSGCDGINMANDVINCNIIGNFITDITSSGVTIGHPQHVYIGDGGTHAKYAPSVERICKDNTITNNLLYDISTLDLICAAITAYFVEGLTITHNHVELTAYNGIIWDGQLRQLNYCQKHYSYNRLITLNRLQTVVIYTTARIPVLP